MGKTIIVKYNSEAYLIKIPIKSVPVYEVLKVPIRVWRPFLF